MKKHKKHIIISVDIENWFHSNWFNAENFNIKYNNCNSDLEHTTQYFLNLFEKNSVTATFFILLNAVEKNPILIESLINTNHEIALHGVEHKGLISLGIDKFKKQLLNGKEKLERLIGSKIIGYRAPNMEISKTALEILWRLGFKYDSSIVPCWKIPGWYGWPRYPIYPHYPLSQKDEGLKNKIIEFPIAVFPYLRIPGGGGWYLRNFGLNWVKLTLKALLKTQSFAVFYIHPWEISSNNPHHPYIPFHVFRRTGEWSLKALESIIKTFKRYASFCSFREYINENI